MKAKILADFQICISVPLVFPSQTWAQYNACLALTGVIKGTSKEKEIKLGLVVRLHRCIDIVNLKKIFIYYLRFLYG